jgi:hypothetical protein
VAFSCKGRGFCPSCMGRRMNATAADLIERVLPPASGLRQWVLTLPFSWRRRLAQDAGLLDRLTRIVVETVLRFYAARAAQEGRLGAKSGAVTVVQRTSSDLWLNPHLHLIVLDGTWHEEGGELAWEGLSHLRTSEVGEVLERLVRRIERHLRRCGLLGIDTDEAEPDGEGDPEGNLAASAVWGRTPPAGPQWVSRLAPLEPHALAYDKPLCASLDGFTLARGDAGGRSPPGGPGGVAPLRPASSGRAGAGGAAPRWAGAHHAKESLRRRDDRGRHGPAVAAVSASHQRAATAPAHHPLRRSAGPGESVEMAPRADGTLRDTRGGPEAPPARARPLLPPLGRSSWHAPSPWTSSPAPSATGR